MYYFLDFDAQQRTFFSGYYFLRESEAREKFYEYSNPYRLVLNAPDNYYDCWDWLNEHSIPNPFACDELIGEGVYVVLYYLNDREKDFFRADKYKSKKFVEYLAYEPVRKFRAKTWKFFPNDGETYFYKKVIIKIPANYQEALVWAEKHNFSNPFEKQYNKSYGEQKWEQIKRYLRRLFLKLKRLTTQK